MSDSRRRFSRATVHMRGRLRAEGVPVFVGDLGNVSLRGVYFVAPNPPAVGLRCEVWIELDGSDLEVSARGRVVRRDEQGCAVELDEIVGIESFEHLKSLVLFNAEHPEEVARELDAHLGILPADPVLPDST